jgi:hypothetical protein
LGIFFRAVPGNRRLKFTVEQRLLLDSHLSSANSRRV